MMYVWNGFSIIGRKAELLEPLSLMIEATINDLMSRKGNHLMMDTLSIRTILNNKIRILLILNSMFAKTPKGPQ